MREREFARRRRLVAVLECEVSEWSSAETYFVNRAPPLHNNTHTHIHIYTNTSLWQYTLIPAKTTQTPHHRQPPPKHPYIHYINSLNIRYKTHPADKIHHQNHHNTGGRLTKHGCRNHWFHMDALACRYTNTSQNHSIRCINIQPHGHRHTNTD